MIASRAFKLRFTKKLTSSDRYCRRACQLTNSWKSWSCAAVSCGGPPTLCGRSVAGDGCDALPASVISGHCFSRLRSSQSAASGLPDTIAIVLALRRSPSAPRLGLSGIGRAPARSSGEVNCKEISAVARTAANTPITCNGRYGRRKPPSINTPGAADPLRTQHTHNLRADPQRLTTPVAALVTWTSLIATTVPRGRMLNRLQPFWRWYVRYLKILRRKLSQSGAEIGIT